MDYHTVYMSMNTSCLENIRKSFRMLLCNRNKTRMLYNEITLGVSILHDTLYDEKCVVI